MKSSFFIFALAILLAQCDKGIPVAPAKTGRLVIDTVRANVSVTQGDFLMVYHFTDWPGNLQFYTLVMGPIGVATTTARRTPAPSIPANQFQYIQDTLVFPSPLALGDTVSVKYSMRGDFLDSLEVIGSYNFSDSLKVRVK